MNVVLYTRDMEPITVIDLPMWALEHGERLGSVNVAAMDPIPFATMKPTDPVPLATYKTVRLEFHRLVLRNKSSWLVTVDNDELALALTPSWLPGQRRKINDYERANKRLASMLLDVLARGVGGH